MEGQIYHAFNKSIAGYRIFNSNLDFERIIELMMYYQFDDLPSKFSYFTKFLDEKGIALERALAEMDDKLVRIIAYCIMPTHLHVILEPLKENGMSIFMSNLLNSYTRYFNIMHKRKGPLWVGRYKKVEVTSDEQLLHLTRYIHLNPVTAYLIDDPGLWPYSSYKQYVGKRPQGVCDFKEYLDIEPESYQEFVNDQIDYQRELADLKDFIIE